MSQSSPADGALPDPWPAQRGAGSVLAPRNWRVACRLIVLVAIPTVLGLALSGLRVTDTMRGAEAYGQVSRLAVVGQEVTGLAQAMQDERADTAAFIADGRPASGLPALHRQYVITNGWAATVRRLVRQLGRGYPARTQAGEATVLASIAELPGLRRQAAQRQAPALGVINAYSVATAGLFPINDGIADLSGNPTLISSVRALGALSRMKDQASQQQAILGVALAGGSFAPGARAALIAAQAEQASDLASFRGSATPEESWALTATLASPLTAHAWAVEQRATAAGPGALALGAQASQQWGGGMSFTVGWMRHAEQQLAAWITTYAQSLQRSAMRSAVTTGGVALAVLLVVLLATMIVARSLVRPLRRLEAAALDVAGARDAVRLAGEEARRRRSVSAVSASFFRRSHSLLERLLRLIDSLELSEDDPGRLASLFQIDHLATRMRRNSDSALVLAGHEAPPALAEPVTLVDVLRAAVSEIEQYGRIVLDVQPGFSVSGSAVADTVHLLAELLENATEFSPRTTQVIVSGNPARGGGSLISITDCGMGMSEDHLRQLNGQLAHPSAADMAVTRHMGLFAVAHLAARHGITVSLGQPPDGGTSVEVHLPAALISPDAEPGGWPGQAGRWPVQAGDVVWARAGQGADVRATDPRFPARRFADGPEPVPGPGTGTPETGQPALGAPLPSPAPGAFFAVAAPGPEGADALPIFASVESGYPRARGRDPLPPGEPQAGLPRRSPQAGLARGAPVDQETPPATTDGSAEITRERLAGFQRGSRRARADVRMERGADQRAQDR